MTLEWSPSTWRDFTSIVDYIAEDDPAAAIVQGNEIEHQIASRGSDIPPSADPDGSVGRAN